MITLHPQMLALALICVLQAALPIWASLPGTPLLDTPLRNFQVQEPLPIPQGVKTCRVELIRHLFANSYGQPAISFYKPPRDCGALGSWAAVVLNLTSTSNGTQYDRLANVYLNNTEIWRTSTPEPTPKGIVWTALKDITRYTGLLSKPGNIVLDLGNIVDASLGLTGEYDVTLSATFYASSKKYPTPRVADIIQPISQNSNGGVFHIPSAAQVALTLPRNSIRAFVEIYATGNGNEEFWYGNIPDEYYTQIPPWNGIDGYAVGKGPFREVQLLIDGVLAGVVFPYPVIYTGEFLPTIWRPMVSYGAFDSPTYYIDITPFVPLLSDGASHNFSIDVIGMGQNRSINSDWIVSGNVQVFLDDSPEPTKGGITSYSAPRSINPTVRGKVEGTAPNVTVTTTANRAINIEANIITGSKKQYHVKWEQKFEFMNTEIYTITLKNISTQSVAQTSSGSSLSLHNGISVLTDTFKYPFSLYLTYNSTLDGLFYDYDVHLDHAFERAFRFPGANAKNIKTKQVSDGSQYKHNTISRFRTGRTTEDFAYLDNMGNTFTKSISVQTLQNTTTASNLTTTTSDSSLLYDEENGSLAHSGLRAE